MRVVELGAQGGDPGEVATIRAVGLGGHGQLPGVHLRWNAKHSGPPELMGQLFHLFESPNRFGLPAFYTLHVWAWKDNPNGAFVNWHPNVSCDSFAGQKP